MHNIEQLLFICITNSQTQSLLFTVSVPSCSTYVATIADSERRCLKITRKQSTFVSSCQPANDLCLLVALVRLSSGPSAVRVLSWSRGAACSVIGLAGSWSTWKKSQCHLVTLGHTAKPLLWGVFELAWCQGRLCFEYNRDEWLHSSTPPFTNTVIMHLWRMGHWHVEDMADSVWKGGV